MKIPKSIIINGVRIKIVWLKELRGDKNELLLGQHDGTADTITLVTSVSADRIGEVFLHELIHAICGDLAINVGEDDLRRLACGLIGVIRQNALDFRR